jgi:UDP-glucose 4-epimerase
LEVALGQRDALPVYGNDYPTPDGTCVRDYVHVVDLAEAHVLALRYLLAEGESIAVNLGTGRGHSVQEIVRAVEFATDSEISLRWEARRPGDPPALVADPANAQRILGWAAKRSLEDMVSSAHQWARRHQDLRLPASRFAA